jgi:hypothetical protein
LNATDKTTWHAKIETTVNCRQIILPFKIRKQWQNFNRLELGLGKMFRPKFRSSKGFLNDFNLLFPVT